jgi:hypothetical protein
MMGKSNGQYVQIEMRSECGGECVQVAEWRGGVVVVAKDFCGAHVRASGEGEPSQNFTRDAPSPLYLSTRRVKVFQLTGPGHISYNLNPKTSLY